jgi:hypothetical protein
VTKFAVAVAPLSISCWQNVLLLDSCRLGTLLALVVAGTLRCNFLQAVGGLPATSSWLPALTFLDGASMPSSLRMFLAFTFGAATTDILFLTVVVYIALQGRTMLCCWTCKT